MQDRSSGGSGSVAFAGSGTNTLTLQTGSTLDGPPLGSTASGATNALMLTGQGTAANNFINFNTLSTKATGEWTLGGYLGLSGDAVCFGRDIASDRHIRVRDA